MKFLGTLQGTFITSATFICTRMESFCYSRAILEVCRVDFALISHKAKGKIVTLTQSIVGQQLAKLALLKLSRILCIRNRFNNVA